MRDALHGVMTYPVQTSLVNAKSALRAGNSSEQTALVYAALEYSATSGLYNVSAVLEAVWWNAVKLYGSLNKTVLLE